MKLSLLTPTMYTREKLLQELLETLRPQYCSEVEHIIMSDDGGNLGGKINRLYEAASGEYVCLVNDDDLVAPDYIATLLDALKENPIAVVGEIEQWWVDFPASKQIIKRRFENVWPVRRSLALEHLKWNAPMVDDSKLCRNLMAITGDSNVVFVDKVLYYHRRRKRG